MSKLIIFDLDDTLIYTHEVYLSITAEFLDKMESLDMMDDNLYYTLDSYDQENVENDGRFLQSAFPRAMLQTYEFYCQKLDKEYDEEQAAQIEEIGWLINEVKYPPVDGVRTLLDTWADIHTLVLVTQGEEDIQKKKVTDNHLQDYFREVIVVPKKDQAVFADVMLKYGYAASDTWIIGNSVRSEITPARSLGANCILVKVTNGWDYENNNQSVDCPIVESLIDCLDIIK